MKKIAFLLVAMAIVLGCDDPSDTPAAPSGFLYGVSSIDAVWHFVKVDAATGILTPLRALPELDAYKGQSAINTDLRHYYITSTDKLFVIDLDDGRIVTSFPLEHTHTMGLVYNAESQVLNAISIIGGLLNLVAIDPSNGSFSVLRNLQAIPSYSGASASITRSGSEYYFMCHRFLYSVDTRDGRVSLPFESPDNIGVMQPRYLQSGKQTFFLV